MILLDLTFFDNFADKKMSSFFLIVKELISICFYQTSNTPHLRWRRQPRGSGLAACSVFVCRLATGVPLCLAWNRLDG